jgi:hypothetical protein
MGPDLGAVYNELYSDVLWLHAKWEQYCCLFKSKRRVELLNETAGYLFRLIQDTLFENVVLGLAKLTDPIETGRGVKQQNLTVLRLPPLIIDGALKCEMSALVQSALTACSAARSWRHKRLAHRDLAVALATTGDPLPSISFSDVEAALTAFSTLLNRLEHHFWNSEVRYVLRSFGDADCLVRYLQKGVKAERAQRERLRTGNPAPEDLMPEEEI